MGRQRQSVYRGLGSGVCDPFQVAPVRAADTGEAIELGIGFKRNIPRKNEEVTSVFQVRNRSLTAKPNYLFAL